MSEANKSDKREHVEFIREILYAALVFVIIALVAFGLYIIVRLLDQGGASYFVIKALTYTEYFILLCDLAGLAIVILVGTLRRIAIFAIRCWKDVSGYL